MSSIKLVSYTQPVNSLKDQGIITAQDLIAYCARVSNPKNQFNTDSADKLLCYMIKHKHWSPFEQVSLTLEITTTRDIARQILRHKSLNFQEHSGRYSRMMPAAELRETRLQDKENRQNSLETDNKAVKHAWEAVQAEVYKVTQDLYTRALNMGIAKELARAILPEGLTESRLYVSGTLRSFIHWIDVRIDPSTQKEHRLLAEEAKVIITNMFPFLNTYYEEKEVS